LIHRRAFKESSLFLDFFTQEHGKIRLVGRGLRNPPIAILVASQYFPAQPIAALVPLMFAIIGFLILLPLAFIMRKQLSTGSTWLAGRIR
jgi:hypothetical protein